jgi:ribokinase
VFDVVVVGSANLDLVARTARLPLPGETLTGHDYHEYPGGKGLNQAVAAARAGASVALLAAVGEDDAGQRLTAVARAEGIDIASMTVLEAAATGRALITVDSDGENMIVVVPGTNALLTVVALPRARVVLAQLEVPEPTVIAAFSEARRAGATTVLNPAPAAVLSAELLALTDVIVPNEHEVDLIGGVHHLLQAGVPTVVVTRGASGADVTTSTTLNSTHFPAIDVHVVDSTGAGDAFCGVLASRLATGSSVHEAMPWAVAAGGLATTRLGAVPSFPAAVDIANAMR